MYCDYENILAILAGSIQGGGLCHNSCLSFISLLIIAGTLNCTSLLTFPVIA